MGSRHLTVRLCDASRRQVLRVFVAPDGPRAKRFAAIRRFLSRGATSRSSRRVRAVIDSNSRRSRRVFRQFCRQHFGASPRRVPDSHRPIALLEFNSMASAHISYAYLAGALRERYDCDVVAFDHKIASRPLRRLTRWSPWPGDVYHAFGARSLIRPTLPRWLRRQAMGEADVLLDGLATKQDLVELTIDGTLVGDLIYDDFLMSEKVPTVDMGSGAFRAFFTESIVLFRAWERVFNDYDVRAVNVSHCVYRLAFPLRIALSRGVAGFQVNATHAYRLSDEQPFAYTEFFNYRHDFARLDEDMKVQGVRQAEARLERRLMGDVGVDMHYSTRSAYAGRLNRRVLSPSSRFKVLVATHCFFDSPHPYGQTLFPDFYEWLTFLGELSERLDYEFYLKVHPDFIHESQATANRFVSKYANFFGLPAEVSHHQLIEEGVGATLTVHGTIGHEYAALGLPVVNASLNNPHIAYDFNVHPSTVSEYEAVVRNLHTVAVTQQRSDINEYYFMHYLNRSENLAFREYQRAIDALGGYRMQFEATVYEYWMRSDSSRHKELSAMFRHFIAGQDYRLAVQP